MQTILIKVQAQKNWAWIGIIFDLMVLFSGSFERNFLNSQQPMIVYEVLWLNFDNVRLYHVHYVPYYLWRKRRNTGITPFESEPGLGSLAEILGQRLRVCDSNYWPILMQKKHKDMSYQLLQLSKKLDNSFRISFCWLQCWVLLDSQLLWRKM